MPPLESREISASQVSLLFVSSRRSRCSIQKRTWNYSTVDSRNVQVPSITNTKLI